MNINPLIIKKIKEIGLKYQDIEKIVLFGSRAREDNLKTSDIDLAVFSKDFKDEAFIRNEIDELDTLLKIDVVMVNDKTDLKLIENILKEGVILMQKSNKIENFINAHKRLKEAIDEYNVSKNTLMRDGLIQRFEFTCELAWKALKEKLMDLGYSEINGPKSIMKEAFANELIGNEEKWVKMINERNLTSHIYDEQTAEEICQRIINEHFTEIEKLASKLI